MLEEEVTGQNPQQELVLKDIKDGGLFLRSKVNQTSIVVVDLTWCVGDFMTAPKYTLWHNMATQPYRSSGHPIINVFWFHEWILNYFI